MGEWTPKENEFFELCEKTNFISTETLARFKQELEREGNLSMLLACLDQYHFVSETCVKCHGTGVFKWGFLGKLAHPDCGWAWYVTPGMYIQEQLKEVFRSGFGAAGDARKDAKKKGESGIIVMILSFVFGVFFRLVFAIIGIPIQIIVSLTQKKP